MFDVILVANLTVAGLTGFFIKRLWGIAAFVAAEVFAVSRIFSATPMTVVIALSLLVPMLVVALNYRSQFRIW